MTEIQCPGCGLFHPSAGLQAPRGLAASGECSSASSLVLSAFYQPELVSERQYVVDAYACTHPDSSTRIGIQTTALCLMTLDLYLECGQSVAEGSQMHQEMMRGRPDFFTRLDPPSLQAVPTYQLFLGVPSANSTALACNWAERVWRAWATHHEQIRAWNQQLVPHRVHS
ncbi:DUF5946 family protein [Deinococcus saxicola]|uniref:DUF5946 family protein n=1 Tax=Deinococcus saxicola TaxID=249406 RepID=UPI0039EF22CF